MKRRSAFPFSQLKERDETWFIALVRPRVLLLDPSQEPYQPYLVLVTSLKDHALRASAIVAKPPTAKKIRDLVLQSMQSPSKEFKLDAYRPRRIGVADPALAQDLRIGMAEEALDIEVVVQTPPAWLQAFTDSFESEIRGGPELPPLISGKSATPDRVGAVYAACAEFYRAAPWVHLSNQQVIAIRHPAERNERYAIVMGQGGMQYGMAMFKRWSDVELMFQYESPEESIPAGGSHSFMFAPAVETPFEDWEAPKKYGWEIANKDAYPVFTIVLRSGKAARPNAADWSWYEAALKAIPRLTREALKPDGKGDYLPIETTLQIPTLQGMLDVAVRYPAGELDLARQAVHTTLEDVEADEGLPFDRRAMEGMLAQAGRELGAAEPGQDSHLVQAQETMYRAWEERDPVKRIALARAALKLSPDCADAYVLLAEESARNARQALELYEKGVAAGERALGSAYFQEMAGDFWGLIETRPYMRAREGVADVLRSMRRIDEAVSHYREMLRLNPGDNQGIRYRLLDLYLFLKKQEEAQELLDEYKEEWSAVWLYTRALLKFQREGASREANKLIAQGLKENSFVPPYLTGQKRLPHHLPSYEGWGDDSEAVSYAATHLNYWRSAPGAVEWVDGQSRTRPKKEQTPRALKNRRKTKPRL